MRMIKSPQNKKIKRWNQLKHKRMRRKLGVYLIESWHLVGTAIQAHQPILTLLATKKQFQLHRAQIGLFNNVILITEPVARKLALTIHPQGIFALVKIPEALPIKPQRVRSGSWLLLDQIQDPGNIGTMVRTADAADFDGVVFGSGTADLYNPKVIRAMQGSQFHLRLIHGDLQDWVASLRRNHLPVYGSQLNPQAVDYRQVPQSTNFALIMGNEGNGMQKSLLARTTENLYIPLPGQAESLNVAVAAGILMFQLRRVK